MTLQLLASGYDFLECPRADEHGGLYFADRTTVYYRRANGSIDHVIHRSVGGIALHAAGGVVLSGPDISHLHDDRLRKVFQLDEGGEFNDIFASPDGDLYAGVVRQDDPSGDRRSTLPGDLWRIGRDGAADLLSSEVSFSNGIGLAPNGTTLYQADTFRREIHVYELAGSGIARNHRVLSTRDAPGYPDGLAVDSEGCLWVAMYDGHCVARFDPSGALLSQLAIPARFVTSVCFSGPDCSTLVVVTCDSTRDISARGCIYETRVSIRGNPVYCARV